MEKRNPRRRGPKSKLTAERADRIVARIREGHFNCVAAAAGGISEKTFYRWLEWGNPEHPEYHPRYGRFLKRVTEATAESEIEILRKINAKGTARDLLELLARRFPDRWSPRHRLEHSGPGGKPVSLEHSGEVKGAAVTIVIENAADVWNEADNVEAEAAFVARSGSELPAHLLEGDAGDPDK
jgi:hypothetical protein